MASLLLSLFWLPGVKWVYIIFSNILWYMHPSITSRYGSWFQIITQNNVNNYKTDQLQQGQNIRLGRIGHSICPVKALMSYLAVRGRNPGALFVKKNWVALTRQSFSLELEAIFTCSSWSIITLIPIASVLEQSLQPRVHNIIILWTLVTAKVAGISDLHIKMLRVMHMKCPPLRTRQHSTKIFSVMQCIVYT